MDGTAYVIGLWPSISEFAADLGVGYGHARIWKHRRSVPVDYWQAVEDRARERGIDGATVRDLLAASARGGARPVRRSQADAS